jgi:hypothetical protein
MQTNCFLVAKETSPPRSFFIVQRTQEITKLKRTCGDNIVLVKKTPKPFIMQRTQEIASQTDLHQEYCFSKED